MTEPHRIGGRYEIDELLGRGGMAEVRKGTDVRLGRTVAVKRLRTDLASDATFQARFRREAQSAASLNHPAIVAVYDTGEEWSDGDGPEQRGVAQPYIVMEYVSGRTLREILREGRKILPERALEITAGVLSALDYSHRAGIIHRDIKPGNVMLTPAGDVKVMDFGIARAVSDTQSTMTQTAAVVGTAQYLSPEQARGENVDSRSDVYSTGCLLYELLTGRPPFVGDSPVAVAYQHVREPAAKPSSLDPDLPPEIDAIVMKALAKPVGERYQSAAAMRTDIERYLAGRPIEAPAVPTTPAASFVPPQSPTGPMHIAPAAAAPEPSKQKKAPLILLTLLLLGIIAAAIVLVPKLIGSAPPQTSVPSVRNLTQQQAVQTIRDKGLTVGDVTQAASAEVDQGRVISQTPDGGDLVDPRTAVDLVISSGPPQVALPDVDRRQQGRGVRHAAGPGLQGHPAREGVRRAQGRGRRDGPARRHSGRHRRPGDAVLLRRSRGGAQRRREDREGSPRHPHQGRLQGREGRRPDHRRHCWDGHPPGARLRDPRQGQHGDDRGVDVHAPDADPHAHADSHRGPDAAPAALAPAQRARWVSGFSSSSGLACRRTSAGAAAGIRSERLVSIS